MITLVCLHGWGGSKESWTELIAALQGTDVRILAPDLPGFGAEPEPVKAWTNDDYALWTETYISKNVARESRLWIIGHSHGGRIAMKLELRKNLKIERLFLCAPAGIRHARHWKRIFGLTLAMIGKPILSLPIIRTLAPLARTLLYKLIRVHDYERASPIMQQTLILITEEDFQPLLKNIKLLTDLFWGTEDGMTPYKDSKIFTREMTNITLHTFPEIRHAVHRDKAKEIASIIQGRIQSA